MPTAPPPRPTGIPDHGPGEVLEKRMRPAGDYSPIASVWAWCRGAWRDAGVVGAWRDEHGWWLMVEWRSDGAYSDVVHEAAVVGWDG